MARPQNDDRQSQHHPRRHSVRPRADRAGSISTTCRRWSGSARKPRPRPSSTSRRRSAPDRPRRDRPRRNRRATPSATTPAGQPGAAAPVVSRDAAIAASPAHQDRDAAALRQHRAEGRAHRRPVAGEIPRHRRSEIARDRAVLAVEHGASLLCRVRLGRGRGLDGAASRPRHGVAAGRLRQR